MTSATARPLRIAGVPEAFNDPFESTAFPSPVEFVSEPGGSGAMLKLLQSNSVDAAFLLTECGVASAANDDAVRLVAPVVVSPLRWAAVVKQGTKPESLATCAWAVSRPGSGSDVMLRVLAERNGWSTPTVKPFGNFRDMAKAVLDGEVGAFLWETHTTRGLMRKGEASGLALLPGVDAPWPAFSVAVRAGCDRVAELREAVSAFLNEAEKFQKDPVTPERVSAKHGMAPKDAKTWVGEVRYAEAGGAFKDRVLNEAFDAVVAAGVVPKGKEFNLGDYVV